MFDIQSILEPDTMDEAKEILANQPNIKIIAGGTDVLIKLRADEWEEVELLSIRKLKSLEEIKLTAEESIVIGALATFSQLCHDPIINKYVPFLADAGASMGGPQIRNIATIGGNVANGAVSADSAPTLFALNAHVKLESKDGERTLPIQEFYLGPGKVDLKPDELLIEIIITKDNYQNAFGHYIKYAMRKAMDIATLGVSVVCKLRDNAYFDDLRIALGVAGPTPIRCLEAENYAKGREITKEVLAEIGKLAVKSAKARDSWRASKEYRESLIEVLTQRAISQAIVNAGGVKIDSY
jgi:xanthine dehydrogenase FAD-binding subunit